MVGIFGYHYIEGWPWIDSFEEAAMLLSGMGPVGQSQTVAGKLFASLYAMWSGLVLVVAMGIILQPFHSSRAALFSFRKVAVVRGWFAIWFANFVHQPCSLRPLAASALPTADGVAVKMSRRTGCQNSESAQTFKQLQK